MFEYKRFLNGLLILCCCWLLVGCSAQPASSQGSGVFYETLDDTGYTVRLNHKPQRIVSLNQGIDEILVDVVEPKRIAALSYLSIDEGLSAVADKAAVVPVILRDRNAEAIIALRPDLILMSDSIPEEVRTTLREMGYVVHVSRSPHNLNEAMQRVQRIADLVGEGKKGEVVVKQMQVKLSKVKSVVDKIPEKERKVIIAFSFSGAFGRADNMFHDMCVQAGVINGAARAGIAKNHPLSKEEIVQVNPDVLLMPTWSSDEKDDSLAYCEEVRNDPAYQTIKAIQNNQLVFVSDRYRYCVSQYAADSVTKIAQVVYPEYFAK